MKVSGRVIAKHIIVNIGITLILVLFIVFPFLPGEYDRLALPLSIMVQVFGVVGLPLVLIGLLWLIMPKRKFAFAIATIVLCSFVTLILALFATLSVGKTFGIITIVAGGCIVIRLILNLKYLKNTHVDYFNAAPLYMIALPVLTLIFQLVFATSVTEWSKHRAISNAKEYIGEIEKYKAIHGHYPESLQAQHKDFDAGVVGVEKYHYQSQGQGYNLFFEQPRFVLDRLGTREWIVYNPRDEHTMYSHTTWLLLTPQTVGSGQGWYASGNTGYLHWKYFWFD